MVMEEQETTEAAPPRKKSRKGKGIIIFSAIAFILMAGGGGVFFLYPQTKRQKEADAAAAAKLAKESEAKLGPLVEMRPLVANLNDPENGRYVKIAIFIETSSEEAKAAVDGAIVPIRSNALVYLSNLTVNDTVGEKGKLAIAERLRAIFEKIVGPKNIRQVYFGEFVVQ
jgi:flagellar basal body-associated protein FliL